MRWHLPSSVLDVLFAFVISHLIDNCQYCSMCNIIIVIHELKYVDTDTEIFCIEVNILTEI